MSARLNYVFSRVQEPCSGTIPFFFSTNQKKMATFTGQQEQQWDHVVFHKKSVRGPSTSKTAHLNAQRRAGNVTTQRKRMGKSNTSAVAMADRVGGAANMCKLETDNESLKHAKVGRELRTAIQQARAAKGLTQKQLATQLNVKVTMIADYEVGRAIPNPQFLVRMEHKLGCTLPRHKKKKSIASAGSSSGASGTSGAAGGARKGKKKKKKAAVVDLMKGLRISK